LDIGRISSLFAQAKPLIICALKINISLVSPVSTVSFRCGYNERHGLGKLPLGTAACLGANSVPRSEKYRARPCRAGKDCGGFERPKHRGGADLLREKLLRADDGANPRLGTAGSSPKSSPPLGGAGGARTGERIKVRRRRGGGRKPAWAYEQSRNVLSFHGHYVCDCTVDQGFRLRTGGGGLGQNCGCTASLQNAPGQVRIIQRGEDLF
jgi:hypothetical protein